MSNCTIAMDEDYKFRTATIVLQLHFFAMFSPGFYTGKLIKHRYSLLFTNFLKKCFFMSRIFSIFAVVLF